MAILCLTCVVAGYALLHAGQSGTPPCDSAEDGSAALIERFLSSTDSPLISYRALRTLEASARGGRFEARLTVWTSLDPVEGFQYSIVEETGSKIVGRKVLRAALDAERSLRVAGEFGRGALTAANYEFAAPESAADGLVRIAIHPKRRDTMLVDGTILVTEDGADLVRVEGLLVKRPSVWTRRVEIQRHYARIAGVRVPVSMQSTARVLLVGTSTFSMTYEYESVNGEPAR
jgi:hypothetical protein